MSKKTFLILSLILLAIIVAIGAPYVLASRKQQMQSAPLLVKTIAVKQEAMPVLWQTTGTVEAKQSVNVFPQVTATIASIDVLEGSHVKAGQILVHLDPTTFQNDLDKAKAILAQDEAKQVSLEKDLKRYKSLVGSGVISQQEYDQALSNALAGADQIKADSAQLKQAELQLNYTTVETPIDGKAGVINVHVGDLVTAYTTQLVTVNQLSSINVVFSIPQDNFNQLMDYQKKNSVQITANSGDNTLSNGKLSFIDNNVNSTTGSVLLKANFDNNREVFWPGQTVSVKIILATEPSALTLPTSAIQLDQQGYFVYLAQNNTAVLQKVTIARTVGDLSVIESGLSAGQVVIATPPPNIKDGASIKATSSAL